MKKDKNLKLTGLDPVLVAPLSLFSHKIKSIKELKDKSTIALPNDPSNLARALILLDNLGLIKIKDPTNLATTLQDVVENPKKINFKPVEAALLPKVLDDVDISIVNGNYALQAGLKNPIAQEGPKSPYANVVAVRTGDQNLPKIKVLEEILHSQALKDFLEQKYHGAVIAAF